MIQIIYVVVPPPRLQQWFVSFARWDVQTCSVPVVGFACGILASVDLLPLLSIRLSTDVCPYFEETILHIKKEKGNGEGGGRG